MENTKRNQEKLSQEAMEEPTVQLVRTTSGKTLEDFSEGVCQLASLIFQNNDLEKPPSQRLVNYGKERRFSLPEVTDGELQRAAYELAFNALKYQELLEFIVLDSRFYLTQSLPDDQMSLVVVMLYNLLERKFIPRKCDSDEFIKEVRDVELHLDKFAVKFAASLARWRVKHGIQSIECMLPESVRMKQERAKSLMLYAWVNSIKSSLDEVQNVLKRAGFSRVRSVGQLQGKTFCQDPHCEDILVFPAQMKAKLDCTSLLRNQKLVIQDKACCVGPNAASQLLQEAENGDVLMAGCFSGLAVSHMASLISVKQKFTGKKTPTVFMCVGDRTEAQRDKIQRAVDALGCRNVKLIPEDFHSLDRSDKQFQKVQVILLAPRSSLSAISNPIEFILQEVEGGTDLLQDLAQGTTARSKLESLVLQQKKDIDQAMQFPNILSVIYTTYSSYPEENEEVVRAVFEQSRICGESSWSQTSLAPFRTPLDSEDEIFKLDPTEHNNGCFMAIFKREVHQDVKVSAADLSADMTKATAKSHRKKSHSVKLKRRVAKSNGSSTSIKKTSTPSPSVKESAEVLLARITSRDSQKSQKHFEKINSWSPTVVCGDHLLLKTVPKAKESTEIVLPKANSSGFKRSPKVELYRKSSNGNKLSPREVYEPAVISLPQVNFPAQFPPRARPRGMISAHTGECSSPKSPQFSVEWMVKTNCCHV